jgi:2'-5' RNA ligase
MRLFIAILLSEEMKKSVTGTMHELKKAGVRGSYVPAQNLHLTSSHG